MAGISKQDVDTPALLVDVDALERNIRKMQDFANGYGVNLRPHCKTHKCTTIAQKQVAAGAFGITCAKLGEAEAMAKAGIRNLLIANQVVGSIKIARLAELARISGVIVAVDDVANGTQISAAAAAAGLKVNVIIEVNTGMNRCGTEPGQPTLKLARALLKLKGLNFRGLMGYEGHAVNIRDFAERKRVVEEALGKLVATAELLRKNKVPVEIVSAGGTGSYKITTAYKGITETQVGSYATMDGAYQDVGVEFE
ncbi:MAG: DSD1 family PLP-dependent enzyme, partial [Planctomycetes bacterium]|nr:DSD1 family PLP-dependent enzyme [Planctomycetota bacterium]